MKPDPEDRLASAIHRELRSLPDCPAPRTLAPRVLAALAARQHAPWWRKAWADWPPVMRSLFLACGATAAGLLILGGWQLPHWTGTLGGGSVTGWLATLEAYMGLVFRLGEMFWLTLKSLPVQVAWAAAIMMGLAYATCVGLGTLGYRLALNRI